MLWAWSIGYYTKELVIDSQTGRPQNRDYLHRDGGWGSHLYLLEARRHRFKLLCVILPNNVIRRGILCCCARLCEQKTGHARIAWLLLRSMEACCLGWALSLLRSIALPAVTLLGQKHLSCLNFPPHRIISEFLHSCWWRRQSVL